MRWLSYIYPQTIARFTSAYNKDIRVVEEHGRYKVLVNGSPQSGLYIKKLWIHAFARAPLPDTSGVKNILILGIGGGTVIHLVSKKYPSADIEAVDIDPTMVEIADTYFGLRKVPNLAVVVEDAKRFVAKSTSKKRYDIIVVDIFVGSTVPDFVAKSPFLQRLAGMRRDEGIVILNYLREKEYLMRSDVLDKTLRTIFSDVRDTKWNNNRAFFVR